MTTEFDRIRSYYSRFDEWGRLDSPEGSIEFRRCLQLLDEFLPQASRVLDLGGGPGRYTVELARRGHRLTLADLSAPLLSIARQRVQEHGLEHRVEGLHEVNAVDLSRYPDQSFDAVLCFGPFYHLTGVEERQRAAAEIARVLRPGGHVFVAYVPRLSGVLGLIERGATRPGQVTPQSFEDAATTGVFRNQSPSGFQEGYYPPVGELEALLADVGFDALRAVSLKSLWQGRAALENQLSPDLRQAVEQVATRLDSDPQVLAVGGHVLIVGSRVPGATESAG